MSILTVEMFFELDVIVAFGDALDGHLSFLAFFAQCFDFFIKLEKTLMSCGIKLIFLNCLANGASSIATVFAVVESTLQSKCSDVGEAFAQSLFIGPHLDFTDAGVIDNDAALVEDEEFASSGGVAAFTGDLVDFVSPLPIVAKDEVDHGGFANAARTDEGDGLAVFEVFFERAQSFAFGHAGDEDGGLGVDLADGVCSLLVLGVGVEVGFVDDNDWLCAAAGDDGEVAFHAPQVEVGACVSNDHDGVDVGDDDLFFGAVASGFAREAGLPWQPCADDVFVGIAEVERNPVADSGEFGVSFGIVINFAAEDDFALVDIAFCIDE